MDTTATGSRAAPAGGRYTVTATTTWQITWSGGGGNTGSQTIDLSSTATVDIDELQVITS